MSFKDLHSNIDSLLTSDKTRNQILKEICVLLKMKVPHYHWVGFYFADTGNKLILGPYAGKPTEHTIIPFGKGVCGQVAESQKLKIVQDVTKEENYISCSIDVRSEIVVPVLKNGRFVAQIDIDSHSPAPFKKEDEDFLNTLCDKISLLF